MIAENKSNPLERLKIIALKRYKSEAHFRMPKPDRKREQSTQQPVGMVIPDLSDKTLFRMVHQWVSDPSRFNISSRIPIGQHELLQYQGVTYKVVSVTEHPIEPAAREAHRIPEDVRGYEVKCLVFKRYQNK